MKYATGFFGIPDGRSGGSKVHIVMAGGTTLCGWQPKPPLEFQWCGDGAVLRFIECTKCRKARAVLGMDERQTG